MKPFFLELFEYSHYMNQQLAERFIANQNLPEKALNLFHHILNAHHIWNSRINGVPSKYKVFESHPASELKYIDRSNFELSCLIVDEAEFEKVIAYTSSQGANYSNTVRDILFHVINHSTYHRAQIASMFRQAGAEPLTSDYIFYKR